MTITLPDEMGEELERKAKASGFDSTMEYLTWLIKTDDERDSGLTPQDLGYASEAELEAKMLASLASGPAVEATPEFWEGLRKQVAERAAGEKS